MSIRVLIADDHQLFAEALQAILGGDERIEVVGRAGNGREAVELAGELKPDVVLMDVSMPLLGGVEATRTIRAASDATAVVMLTGSDSRADVVCGPALIEPFGQALLEALACGRNVVATRIGGPPEFVPPDAGVLVDPLDVDELARALEAAAALPVPNEAARAAAAKHDVRLQAERLEEILLRAVRDRRA